ncbi:MAG: hypothetical protein M5U28_01195 [Sandaracinaceae bacterium]|nr:hypothetical protein [Sandaracinaceae bacterium]
MHALERDGRTAARERRGSRASLAIQLLALVEGRDRGGVMDAHPVGAGREDHRPVAARPASLRLAMVRPELPQLGDGRDARLGLPTARRDVRDELAELAPALGRSVWRDVLRGDPPPTFQPFSFTYARASACCRSTSAAMSSRAVASPSSRRHSGIVSWIDASAAHLSGRK